MFDRYAKYRGVPRPQLQDIQELAKKPGKTK
jgi:hypothetical protein